MNGKCQWCGNEDFKLEETERLEIYLPHYTGPRIHIKNDLCPDCALATRKAIGEAEMALKRAAGAH